MASDKAIDQQRPLSNIQIRLHLMTSSTVTS